MINAIIFDFGDVFINLEKEASIEAFKKIGLDCPNDDLVNQNDLFEKGQISELQFMESCQKYIPNASIVEIVKAVIICFLTLNLSAINPDNTEAIAKVAIKQIFITCT